MKVDRLLLLVIPLLFLGASFVNAGPVGDFFKKVGRSISKPLQHEPQPQSTRPQPTKTSHAARRPTSRTTPPAAATESAVEQASNYTPQEDSTGTWRAV